MGVDCYYFNRDKSQFFPSGLFHYCGRFKSAGQGLGGRALAILLSEYGTWRNDRISLIADMEPEFGALVSSSVDIEVDVEIMLLDFDGTEWIKDALVNSIVFEEMCALAILMGRGDVIALLDEKFGTGKWQKKYQEHLKCNSDYWSRKIVEARNSGLKILIKQGRAG